VPSKRSTDPLSLHCATSTLRCWSARNLVRVCVCVCVLVCACVFRVYVCHFTNVSICFHAALLERKEFGACVCFCLCMCVSCVCVPLYQCINSLPRCAAGVQGMRCVFLCGVRVCFCMMCVCCVCVCVCHLPVYQFCAEPLHALVTYRAFLEHGTFRGACAALKCPFVGCDPVFVFE
jgi:hypothetical protein